MLKSTIPVANIRFFEKTPTVADLERRFSRFLRGFRERKHFSDAFFSSRNKAKADMPVKMEKLGWTRFYRNISFNDLHLTIQVEEI